jgi:cytochrome o ubiquinol oxidase subunit II
MRIRPMRVPPVFALLALAGCRAGVLDPMGPVSDAEKTILIDSVVIMLAIVLPTIAATLAFAFWFRAGNKRAFYLPYWAYSGRIELVVWSIPVLTVILLGGVAWIGSHQLDPGVALSPASPRLRVQVVSLDWKWLFIYPDQGIASVNQLALPVDVPVEFSLTSGSVMTVFFIPQLGSMIYTMNRMVTRLNLKADQTGSFRGQASHFSGDGFPDMHFVVRSLPQDQFDAWIAGARRSGQSLDDATYRHLEQQSINDPERVYARVDVNLFHRIVDQELPPAPGPQSGRPTPDVSPRSER